jgi:hypothetical protein
MATQSSCEEAAFLGLLLFDMCTLPLDQISPAFIYFGLKIQLSLEEMFSVLSNKNAFV